MSNEATGLKNGPRRRVTADDVARAAGTSQSAVSRVFTPGASVSAELREKVSGAARAMGYRPNAIARSLITRRSRIIALAMAYLDNQFYPDVIEALSARLQEQGYQILLFTAKHGSIADPVFEQVMRYQVDAVVLASTLLSSALARECRAAGVPVVLFNRRTDDPDISSVTGDNERGGRAIAEFFADAGYKRLGYIAGLENSSTNRDREAGFRTGIAARKLTAPVRAVGGYNFDGAAEAARALLSRPERPEAIFAANDHMAFAAMEVARHEFKLRIPEDIGFIGFDNVSASGWPSFSLTSFSQPLEPMVGATVELITGLLEKPDQAARRTIVAGELIVRNSTRSPPGNPARGRNSNNA